MTGSTRVRCPKCGFENDISSANCLSCNVNLKWAFENIHLLAAEARSQPEPGPEQAAKLRRLRLERTAPLRIVPSDQTGFLVMGVLLALVAVGIALGWRGNVDRWTYAGVLGAWALLLLFVGALSLRHVRLLKSDTTTTTADVIGRYIERNVSGGIQAPVTNISIFVIAVQFEANGERVRLRALISEPLYVALKHRNTVEVRYANANPLAARLEGEFEPDTPPPSPPPPGQNGRQPPV